MLHYFYILICIRLCFCYECIDKQQLRKRNKNNEFENAKREKRNLVQFDMANFLRNIDTEKSQVYDPYAYKNKDWNARTQSEYDFEPTLNENIKKRDDNINYLNVENVDSDLYSSPTKDDRFDLNPQFFGKIAKIEGKHVSNRGNKVMNKQNELLNDIQNPEEKCAFKDMKVPFFSRKPSMAKKQKKKLICVNCTKTYPSSDALKSEANTKIKQLSKQIKRAYGNLCPKCVRELFKRREKAPDNINQIQNSREFYQNVASSQGKDKQPIYTFEDYYLNSGRIKREDNEERERQLKEIAEVEKKVDRVQVSTPKLKIVPLKLSNDRAIEITT